MGLRAGTRYTYRADNCVSTQSAWLVGWRKLCDGHCVISAWPTLYANYTLNVYQQPGRGVALTLVNVMWLGLRTVSGQHTLSLTPASQNAPSAALPSWRLVCASGRQAGGCALGGCIGREWRRSGARSSECGGEHDAGCTEVVRHAQDLRGTQGTRGAPSWPRRLTRRSAAPPLEASVRRAAVHWA